MVTVMDVSRWLDVVDMWQMLAAVTKNTQHISHWQPIVRFQFEEKAESIKLI